MRVGELALIDGGQIADRTGAEQMITEQDQRLADVYEHAGIGIAEVSAEGKLLRVNAHLARLLGRKPEDLLGRSIFDPDLAEAVAADEAQFRRQVQGEIDHYTVEKVFRRHGGGKLCIAVDSASIRDADGRFLYAVRVQRDITGWKKAEEMLARRAEEQAALYEFVQGLQLSRTPDEVYERALAAIFRALRCQRAAVLLLDNSGVMRFVAARGLSEAYCRIAEGHTPWEPETRNPEAIFIGNADHADLSDDVAAALRTEGIGALAFIPIMASGRLIGKFMAYYDCPCVFADSENDLALTIARQIGLSIERLRAEAAHRRAEEALRESETRKSAILRSALDGIITMDEAGRILELNPAAERLLGYRKEDVLGRTAMETMVPRRLRGAHWPDLEEFLAAGQAANAGNRIEMPILRADGSEFEAEVSVSASRLENGSMIITGYLRDITEARRAERAAQHLAAIVESSHDAIVSKNLDGIIQTWNHGAERLFGYSAEEAVGKSITLVIPPDRLDEEPEILARIRRGERVDHFETIRRRKDGTLIDISLTISPVRDQQGRIVGASKIARDITDRKEAELKLRESEQKLQDLLAAIPAAIYTTDAQGRITYYNQAAVELAGRTPKIGSDEWCVTWKLYLPDGTPLPHEECPMAVALKEGRPIRNAEAVAERPDGTRVPFIPYPTPIRDARGRIVGAINMLVDISERRQAETQQRVLFNELNHRVKNNMQMLQSLLHMSAKQTGNPDARRILTEASCRIAAMAAAQQVLYGTTDATRYDAQEFLKAVCQTVQQTFPREAKITCEAGDVELSNETAMPLALILNELLTNAVKHGAQGNAKVEIRAGLTRQNGSCVLYVEDDGPGFDLKSVQHRASGLQLVQGLARQLRGKFEVRTTPKTRCSVQFS
ncbi:MAG TPA: PAS domain S-box protein [Methylovirgula sp.]|nr:PAS domain S-box protein [Methylovirgula sp.]